MIAMRQIHRLDTREAFASLNATARSNCDGRIVA